MKSEEMLRYVVLHHTGIAQAHFDLMLETSAGSKLATWRLPNWPPKEGDAPTPLEDHRREYLEFEGAISGNRGEVRRVASGHLRKIEKFDQRMTVTFGDGRRLALPSPG
jgi:hypothetical protein